MWKLDLLSIFACLQFSSILFLFKQKTIQRTKTYDEDRTNVIDIFLSPCPEKSILILHTISSSFFLSISGREISVNLYECKSFIEQPVN